MSKTKNGRFPPFSVPLLWAKVVRKPQQLPEHHLTHIAPVAFRHINMHGKMRFALDDYAWLTSPKGQKAA